jgi:hypothetical protein
MSPIGLIRGPESSWQNMLIGKCKKFDMSRSVALKSSHANGASGHRTMPLFFRMVSCGVRTGMGDLHRTCRYHTCRAGRSPQFLALISMSWPRNGCNTKRWGRGKSVALECLICAITALQAVPPRLVLLSSPFADLPPTSLVLVPGPSRKIRQDLEEKMTNVECPMGLL